MKPIILSRKIVYESEWLDLYLDKVQFPGGRVVDRHHFIEFKKEGVAAVVINEKDEILLIQAYRYLTDSIEWEIPAGGIEENETMVAAAIREVFEETGFQVGEAEFIYSFKPLSGISNKMYHVIGCKAIEQSGTFDRNEVEDIRWVPITQILKMIDDKVIRDGFSLTALLIYLFQIYYPKITET